MATGGTGTALSVVHLPVLIRGFVTFCVFTRLRLYLYFPEAVVPLASLCGFVNDCVVFVGCVLCLTGV